MSEVSVEKAMEFVRSHPAAASVNIKEISAFWKVISTVNGHHIYIKKGGRLGQIDTNLPIKGEPGTRPLNSSNGSITCHIEPDLEHLGRFLGMLADGSLGKHKKNTPRPFRTPAAPRPPRAQSPVVERPVPLQEVMAPDEPHAPIIPGPLKDRIRKIRESAARAKARRLAEEQAEQAERSDSGPDEVESEVVGPEDAEGAARARQVHRQAEELRSLQMEEGVEVGGSDAPSSAIIPDLLDEPSDDGEEMDI